VTAAEAASRRKKPLSFFFFGDLTPVLNAIKTLQTGVTSILTQTGKIMSDTDNLVAALPGLTAAINGGIAAIETEIAAIASANTGNNPAIAEAVTNIKNLTAAMNTEVAKVTPPSPPSP
jgi:hypothetical protein